MDKQLFTSQYFSPVDTLVFTFGDVELLCDLSVDCHKGRKFAYADMDYERGILEFGNEKGEVEYSFKLHFQVTPT